MELARELFYTYADYQTWDDGKRYELIDGYVYMMAAAPLRRHQEAVGNLYYELKSFLKGKTCEVYVSPFDVRLNYNNLDNTVVQPDIVVVCDPSKLDDKGCNGAPDMVAEVLSTSTARYDTITKMRLYQRVGMKEYWVVDPEREMLSVFILENGKYTATFHYADEVVDVQVLEGCQISLSEVFAETM